VIGLQLNRRLPARIEEPAMTRFESTAALAVAERGQELRDMSDLNDLKREVRDTKSDVKEGWRRADGDESLGDKLANTTDRIKDKVENTGDELHEEADKASRDMAYEKGRADEISRSR
jgi:hypothetical protein